LARINIEETFWDQIRSVAVKIGNEDIAIGQALRLFRLAQERFKQGRIVSDEDWKIHEFSEFLIPKFAKKVDGGYEFLDAEKHFGWLVSRQKSGQTGGQKSGESRRSKINTLTEANASKPKRNEPSSSSSLSNTKVYTGNLLDVWNQNCGNLPKEKALSPAQEKQMQARTLEYSLDEWTRIVKKIAASDFCNGRTKTGTWRADFDWLLKPGTFANVDKGKYDNHGDGAMTKHNGDLHKQKQKVYMPQWTGEERGPPAPVSEMLADAMKRISKGEDNEKQ